MAGDRGSGASKRISDSAIVGELVDERAQGGGDVCAAQARGHDAHEVRTLAEGFDFEAKGGEVFAVLLERSRLERIELDEQRVQNQLRTNDRMVNLKSEIRRTPCKT